MRPEHLPRLTASATWVSGDGGDGLTALADALLLITADPALDEALRIAHTFTINSVHRQSRRRILEHAASTLRDHLLSIEQQLHEAA
ncbi:MAG: hypothetical protein WCF99_01025 [Chloroflexales bacterium]